jgi:hypothetical protein
VDRSAVYRERMSVSVDLAELIEALADFDYAYLLTVNDDGRPHAVAVAPRVADGELVFGDLGRRSVANTASRSNVSLLFPPREVGGYSLILDGDATVDGDLVRVTPVTAVLHRPAQPGGVQPAEGCVADCRPIDLEPG